MKTSDIGKKVEVIEKQMFFTPEGSHPETSQKIDLTYQELDKIKKSKPINYYSLEDLKKYSSQNAEFANFAAQAISFLEKYRIFDNTPFKPFQPTYQIRTI